jgi:hypothetical protein
MSYRSHAASEGLAGYPNGFTKCLPLRTHKSFLCKTLGQT